MSQTLSADASVVKLYARFDDLPQAGRDLFDPVPPAISAQQPQQQDCPHSASNAGSGFFGTLPWFRHLSDTVFSQHHRLRLYSVSGTDRQPLLILPMVQNLLPGGFLKARRLDSLSNFYSPLFGPATALPEAQCQPPLLALTAAMAQDRRRWDIINLHPLNLDSPLSLQIEAGFRQAGMAVQRYFCFGNWYLDVAGRPYQTYFDGLPSRLRNTVTRKTAQLGERLRIDIVVDDSNAQLERHIAAYETIYRSSWKQAEAFPTFIPGLIRLSAAQGCLRLGLAYVDEQPAAAQLWIVRGGVASIVKLAYDARFARLSVGSILTDRMMRHAIDIDRVAQVDYLSGDDTYKQDWMSKRRERWGLIAFNIHSVRGAMLALRHFGAQALKRLFFLRVEARVSSHPEGQEKAAGL